MINDLLLLWAGFGFILWCAVQSNKKYITFDLKKEIPFGIVCGPIVIFLLICVGIAAPFVWAVDKLTDWLDD